MSRVLKLSLCTTLLLVLLVVHLPTVLPSPVDYDSSDHYFRQHERSRYDHVQAGVQPGKRGAVASESAICSRHGTDIILMGGNAADAVRFLFSLQLLFFFVLIVCRWSRRCFALALSVSSHQPLA